MAQSLAVMLAWLAPIVTIKLVLYLVSPLPYPPARAAWLAGYRACETPAVRLAQLGGLREVLRARGTPEARLAARAWIPTVRQALSQSKRQPSTRRAAADLLGELGDPRSHVRMLPARAETARVEYRDISSPVSATLWAVLSVADSSPDIRGLRLHLNNPARSHSSDTVVVRVGLQDYYSGDLYSVSFDKSGIDLNVTGSTTIERHAPALDADEARLELRVNEDEEFSVSLNGRSLWNGLPAWEDGLAPVIQVWGSQEGRVDLAFRDVEVLRHGRWEPRSLRFEGGITGLALAADGDVTRFSGTLVGARATVAHAGFGFQAVRGVRWSMTTQLDPAASRLGTYYAWAMLQAAPPRRGFVQLGWAVFPPGGIGAPTLFATSGQGWDVPTYQTMWLPRGSHQPVGNAGEDGSVHRYELRIRDDGEAVMRVDGVEIYGPAAGPLYSTALPPEPLHVSISVEPQAVGQRLDVVFKDIEVLKGGLWVRPGRADDTYAAPGLYVRDEGHGVWRAGGTHTGAVLSES